MSRLVKIPNGELNAFDLPPVCVVTGKTEGVVFQPVKFSWYPRWIAIFAPFALLIAAILAAILTRRVKGELPFTPEAYKLWKLGRIVFGFSIFAALAMFVFGIGLSAGGGSSGPFGLVLLVGALAVPLAVGLSLVRGRGPVVKEISATHITLKLPNAGAAVAISRHLVAGSLRPAPAAAAVPVGVELAEEDPPRHPTRRSA